MRDIERNIFLYETILKILKQKDITLTEIAKRLWVSHAYISQNLNWRRIPLDDFYEDVMRVIPITPTEITNIFKQADRIYFKNKYWDDLDKKEMSYEEIFELIQEKENLTATQIEAVKDFIKFQKNK